jgi:hypothetical protein
MSGCSMDRVPCGLVGLESSVGTNLHGYSDHGVLRRGRTIALGPSLQVVPWSDSALAFDPPTAPTKGIEDLNDD